MPEIELDPQLLSDFIVESNELLDEFSANLIELENNPEDMDVVGAIFRAAHTLKGSSAFFNLTHIKSFAHKLENLLDEVRNRRRRVDSRVIDFLLSGGNHLKAMFERVSAGEYGTDLTAEQDQFLQELLSFLGEAPAEAPSAEEVFRLIQAATAGFKEGGREPESVLLEIDSLVGDFLAQAGWSEAKAEAAPEVRPRYLFGETDLSDPVCRALAVFEEVRDGGSFEAEAYDQALSDLQGLVETHNLEPLREPLAAALDDFRAVRESAIGFDELLVGLVEQKLKEVVDKLEVAAAEEAPAAPAEEARPAERKEKREDGVERKTMRIDEEKVDGFMSYVGELIVTAETFNYLQKAIENENVHPHTVKAFKNANQAFRELSDDLQESLMEIRRVPIKGLMQKVALMARDLSQKMGKKVKVQIEDHDVRVDKSIAENLEGPMIHLVRNSVDHGLELPEEREQTGKPAEGSLAVRAWADKEFFYLEIFDNGRGLNPDKIRKAALNKGLLSAPQAQALSDREAINLIFGAEFSTAEKVTDVSGRGVGMDVVRNNIAQVNGTISLDSEPGQSTTISLKIPTSVTLQVIKGLLVRVSGENFIISLDDIVESLRPLPGELSTVEGKGEIITRRGQIHPLIRLYEVFDLQPQITDPTQAILVLIESSRGRFCLLVDKLLGQQQVVVKGLGAQFKNLECVAGSAILGDGRLGLVLEAEGLIRLAHGR